MFIYKDNTAIIVDRKYGILKRGGPEKKMRLNSKGEGLKIRFLRKMKNKNSATHYWLGKVSKLEYCKK